MLMTMTMMLTMKMAMTMAMMKSPFLRIFWPNNTMASCWNPSIPPVSRPPPCPACLSANLLAQGRPSRLALLPPHHLLPLPASLPTDWFTLIIMGVAFMVKNISMALKPKTTINAPWR